MLLRDTALIFGRYARQTLRSGIHLAFGIMMPLLYLIFFGPLLTELPLGGRGDSWQILVPGLLLQLVLFGSAFAGFGLIVERGHGVLERMRVTPVSRTALLLGRVLRDAALLVLQSVLLVLAALAVGLRAPLAGVLIGFAFVGVLATALAALSYALASLLPVPQTFGPIVNATVMPVMLLSGLILPTAIGPGWLDTLSRLMPLRHLVDAVRAAYTGSYTGAPMLYGSLVAVALTAAAVAVGTRAIRRPGG
ncbi:ABC transporter permease [Streptomyces sp. NPDC020875]|uniref:ABC transporter permease n=1 Tax=Streptomyces sp. NPDC020875 TaxID=3154898 RepID=UPI0033CEB168